MVALSCVPANPLGNPTPPAAVDSPAVGVAGRGAAVYRTAALPPLKLPAADSPAPDQLTQAKTELTAASQRVAGAQQAADKANSALAAAKAATAAATNDYNRFTTAQQAAATAANEAVGRLHQTEQALATAKAKVDQVQQRIAAAAKAAYVEGTGDGEWSLLLSGANPDDSATAGELRSRLARGNATLLSELDAAEADVAKQRDAQRKLADEATGHQQDSDRAAAAAQGALAAARASESVEAQTAAAHNAALAQERAAAAALQQSYDRLMAQKQAADAAAAAAAAEKAAAEKAAKARATGAASTPGASGFVATRTGQAAVDWAMGYVGAGSEYFGLCLKFVDDAFAPTGGRVGSAIEQWNRANAAGYGHPGDRNPPVGAQVFWLTSDPARHATIYAGGGMVITTEAYGGRVGIVPMEAVDSWGPYVGWASPYYG